MGMENADGNDGSAAHRKHGRDRHHSGDERHGDIHRAQGGGAHALPHENAVHHIVEVGHEQAAQRRKDIADQSFGFFVHIGFLQKKKWGKALPASPRHKKSGVRPITVLSHFNDSKNRKSSDKQLHFTMRQSKNQLICAGTAKAAL